MPVNRSPTRHAPDRRNKRGGGCSNAGANTALWVVSFRSSFLRCRRVFSNLPAAKWLAPGKDIVYDLRKMINNSTLSRNLEQAVTRYVAWLERQAPGA